MHQKFQKIFFLKYKMTNTCALFPISDDAQNSRIHANNFHENYYITGIQNRMIFMVASTHIY